MRTQYDVVLCSGVHSKKILLQSTSSLVEVPVTAVLGRLNVGPQSSTQRCFRKK